MIRCITWSDDEETFKSDKQKDVWQSPPFFMEMRKGDMEDHALLMCNLFLGLGLDAYVCVGRLEGAKEFEKRHVWVLTRHKDDSVKMWETSTGKAIVLPGRYDPLLCWYLADILLCICSVFEKKSIPCSKSMISRSLQAHAKWRLVHPADGTLPSPSRNARD